VDNRTFGGYFIQIDQDCVTFLLWSVTIFISYFWYELFVVRCLHYKLLLFYSKLWRCKTVLPECCYKTAMKRLYKDNLVHNCFLYSWGGIIDCLQIIIILLGIYNGCCTEYNLHHLWTSIIIIIVVYKENTFTTSFLPIKQICVQ